jgi:hypothetical protein
MKHDKPDFIKSYVQFIYVMKVLASHCNRNTITLKSQYIIVPNMKHCILILTSLFALFFISCNSQTASEIFYDENDYNTVREIQSFENKLFILGWHFIKEGATEKTTSILCLDTSLNKLWDKHYGNLKSDEEFKSFSITKDGSLFVAGSNNNLKSAILLKINQKGELIWRKEYNSINSFENLEIYNNNSIIIVGTKRFTDTDFLKDSSVIQKLDLQGNVIWTKPICPDLGLRFMKLTNDKIIFCTNAGFYSGGYPDSKLFCLDQNGQIAWTYNLDLKNTGIDKGVKAINLKIDNNNKDIYALCQSHNVYITTMSLFKFNLSGQKTDSYTIDLSTLKSKENNHDKYFLFTGLNINAYKQEPFQIVIRKDSQNNPYFSSASADNQLINFIELNHKTYIIANKGELEKHHSAWQVLKLDK